MTIFSLYDKSLGTVRVTKKGNSYILGYPCDNSFKCSPYFASLPKGKYRFELWGAGNTVFNNGAYVSGLIRLEKARNFYFFVGGKSTFFNSCDTNATNGTRGNGASDIRLSYNGVWHEFDSLKSRIIVAGAGGNQNNDIIGSISPNSVVTGNYGQAGGIVGYEGKMGFSEHFSYVHVFPGEPGEQTKGGKGGLSPRCKTYGGDGSFGKGGISGISCANDGSLSSNPEYRYHGSGGYYGSGGSGGYCYRWWDSFGTAGGSSFISGHRGCDAITEDSTESNINHTKYPYHYSGLTFYDTMMIDGTGRTWVNETAGDFIRMMSPLGGKYSKEIGHGGNGYIRITFLIPKSCAKRTFFLSYFMYVLMLILVNGC